MAARELKEGGSNTTTPKKPVKDEDDEYKKKDTGSRGKDKKSMKDSNTNEKPSNTSMGITPTRNSSRKVAFA